MGGEKIKTAYHADVLLHVGHVRQLQAIHFCQCPRVLEMFLVVLGCSVGLLKEYKESCIFLINVLESPSRTNVIVKINEAVSHLADGALELQLVTHIKFHDVFGHLALHASIGNA